MAFEKTVVAAQGRWKGILVELGMDAKILDGEHHPCPFCGGKDRFRFTDRDGKGTWWCQCRGNGESGMALAMRFLCLPFPETAKRVDAVLGVVQVNDPRPTAQTEEKKKRDSMRDMFRASSPVQPGDPVHRYLTRRCGDPAGALGDIRFHPALFHKEAGARFPAMLAFMGWDPILQKFCGIHRTYLTEDGQKAPVPPGLVRKNYGPAGPVRLGPAAERMGIGEGIETALCGAKLFDRPVWSGICAHGMETWSPPPEAREILILGDNDANFVGQAAANDLAKRLRSLGMVVEVQIPPNVGTDWCDVWAAQAQLQGVA
jgi:putative DNA primase/helicase